MRGPSPGYPFSGNVLFRHGHRQRQEASASSGVKRNVPIPAMGIFTPLLRFAYSIKGSSLNVLSKFRGFVFIGRHAAVGYTVETGEALHGVLARLQHPFFRSCALKHKIQFASG